MEREVMSVHFMRHILEYIGLRNNCGLPFVLRTVVNFSHVRF